ncbi:hypothetical protein E4U54_004597 [Claviceps lovelessii]|nr:hypothetical protein E4U54_004597 [Claviceps lovelessii]
MSLHFALIFLAGEGDLWSFFVKKIRDFLVGHTANLVIMVHNLSIFVTNAAGAGVHKAIACLILGTDIAIYPSPTCIAIARSLGSHRPISASGKRATHYIYKSIVESSPK